MSVRRFGPRQQSAPARGRISAGYQRYRPADVSTSELNTERSQRQRLASVRNPINQRIRSFQPARRNLVRWIDQRVVSLDQEFIQITITHATDNSFEFLDFDHYLRSIEGHVQSLLTAEQRRLHGLVWSMSSTGLFSKASDPTVFREKVFASDSFHCRTVPDIRSSVVAASRQQTSQRDQLTENGSDWVLDNMIRSVLRIFRWTPPASSRVRGGGSVPQIYDMQASAYLPTPAKLINKRCCVNVKNFDNRCFKYAMKVAWTRFKDETMPTNGSRPSTWDNIQIPLDFTGTVFPVRPCDVDEFEKQNKKFNLAIDVFYFDNATEHRLVIRKSLNKDVNRWYVPLLIVAKNEDNKLVLDPNNQVDFHWIFISNLDSFVVDVASSNSFTCKECFSVLNERHHSLESHAKICDAQEGSTTLLPEEDKAYRYFFRQSKKNEKPFVIYCDFEAFNRKIEHSDEDTKTQANRKTEHLAASFCFTSVCADKPSYSMMNYGNFKESDWGDYNGQPTNIGKQFMDCLIKEERRIQYIIDDEFSFPVDENDETDLTPFKSCQICELPFAGGFCRSWQYHSVAKKEDFDSDEEYYSRLRAMKGKMNPGLSRRLLEENSKKIAAWDPTKDTNNVTGACHFYCSKSIANYGMIPVVFHNLSGYDSHLILQSLDSRNIEKFSAIPQRSDTFMSFSVGKLNFIDSYRLQGSSLDSLVKMKATGSLLEAFPVFTGWFSKRYPQIKLTEETLKKICRKGEFPYDWFDHPDRFKEKQLPTQDKWFNFLRNEAMDESDFTNAQEMWKLLKCKNFEEYHDFYLFQDVLLLADVFQDFRRICRREDDLEPFAYISLPGYCFDSMLKMQGCTVDGSRIQPFELKVFDERERDKYEFIEQSIRGGISMTPGRYAKANHQFMDSYDPSQVSSFIQYYDANNLYGGAMSMQLPIGDYQWCEELDLAALERFHLTFPDVNYFVEVSGFFPDDTHDYLRDFPPCPVNHPVEEEDLSSYSSYLNEILDSKHDNKTKKLLCTLKPRQNYVVHLDNLTMYRKLGFVVTQVHRVLKFTQSDWLKKYVTVNTEKRKLAKTKFEQDFFKLKVNSVYGKFIQNNRRHEEVVMIRSLKDKHKHDPFLTDFRIVNEHFVLAKRTKPSVLLDSPIIIGSTILENSKVIMYGFWYWQIKANFGNRVRLIFTDTDSLCMQIESSHLMDEFKSKNLLNFFDLADWPKDESYHGSNWNDPVNKKVVGKFKDEMAEKRIHIEEVVALKSKMYSLKMSDPKQNKSTLKGVSRSVKEQNIRHEHYVEALNEIKQLKLPNRSIRHQNNHLYTTSQLKSTLSSNDSKLFIADATTAYPYGHYQTRQNHLESIESEL